MVSPSALPGSAAARAVLICGLVGTALSGLACLGPRFVGQAAHGQFELLDSSRPIGEVLRDPDTDDRTRVLLAEVERVKRFARAQGLATKGNYDAYVGLSRPAVVWFLTASEPLRFEPKVWSFPIVGSFPYLGWFSLEEALRYRRRLRAQGWEVYLRPVHAYSTGGWFRDPVLSSMFSPEDDALRVLANVLLHELTHANVLVNDQSVFNESVASFVGDHMTVDYLSRRFGAQSEQLARFRSELAEEHRKVERLWRAYRTLERVYASNLPEAAKRRRKEAVIEALDVEFGFAQRPNNAMLMGFKVYNAGQAEFARLFEVCRRDWRRFLRAVGRVEPDDFREEQQEQLEPIIRPLIAAGCPRA
jgi:predicted aminopeptidase